MMATRFSIAAHHRIQANLAVGSEIKMVLVQLSQKSHAVGVQQILHLPVRHPARLVRVQRRDDSFEPRPRRVEVIPLWSAMWCRTEAGALGLFMFVHTS